jgi:glutathione S-transferase
MADEVVFYHNPQSRASMAHWMLEEVGAPYRIVPIDFAKDEQKSPAFLAVNPMGKLPTIVHKGVVITETAAIIAYLADTFPEAGLAPPIGDPRRGTWYRWLFFGAGCIEPALMDTMMNREPGRAMAMGYGTFDDTLNAVRGALTPGPYILGDTFSAADLYIDSELNFGGMFGAQKIKDDPLFTAYVDRLKARPAYQRAQGVTADA